MCFFAVNRLVCRPVADCSKLGGFLHSETQRHMHLFFYSRDRRSPFLRFPFASARRGNFCEVRGAKLDFNYPKKKYCVRCRANKRSPREGPGWANYSLPKVRLFNPARWDSPRGLRHDEVS